MQHVGFNVGYIDNYPETLLDKNEFLLSTYAMHWCMMATHMHRLFTKSDMHEFLFRLAITLDTLKVMEKWFSYDKLLDFKYHDQLCTLNADDILFHYGLEVTDSVNNGKDRDFHMDNISNGIFNAMLAGALEGYQVIEPKKAGNNTFEISGKKHSPVITDQLIKNAEFFASDIIQMRSDEFFKITSERKTAKLAEIEERKIIISKIPEFDIDKIPEATIHECLELMVHPDYYTYLTEKADKEEYEKECYHYIYIAWLWANDLMVSDGITACEVEGVYLDHDEYELQGEDDGGINLLQTYYDYNIEEVIPLLNGVGLK